MSHSNDANSYYIRIRGKILGPYTTKQLNTLRSRGQFSQWNEISTDGKTWEPAVSLHTVFAASTKKVQTNSPASIVDGQQNRVEGATSTVPTTSKETMWHYSVDGEQHGPVPLNELQEMLDFGRLTLRDLVWKDGMTEWSPASDIAELTSKVVPQSRTRKNSKHKGVGEESTSTDDSLAPHFLDLGLNWLRSAVHESSTSTIGMSFIELGRYALYLSIVLNLVFTFISAVKIDSLDIGLMGVGYAVVALVLQFSAVKSCGALNQLIQTARLRMSSRAFLDSMILILLFGGMVTLVSSAVVWIRYNLIISLVVGIAFFLVCELLGLMILHPNAIGITISSRASSGEDAIAILSFILMLPLRFVSVAFGMGVTLSILGTGVAFYMLYSAETQIERMEAILIAQKSGQIALGYSAFPLLMYVYFVFIYVIVDVIRSILVIPDKMDQLALLSVKEPDEVRISDGESLLSVESAPGS